MSFVNNDGYEYRTVWSIGGNRRENRRKYGLKLISTPDKFQPSGTVVLVPPMGTPRQLLAFYNAMLRHEDDVDAVIVCGIESCEAASTVQYCTPPGKFFSLGGDLEPEELESELYVILDSLFAEGNQINF